MFRTFLFLFVFSITTTLSGQDSIWPKVFEGERGTEILETYDKGFILCGATHKPYGTDFDYGILKKVDINGNQLWQKYIGAVPPPGFTMIDEIFPTGDDGYIIAGFTRMYNGAGLTYVMKLNVCLEEEWSHIFYSEEGNQASSGVVQLEDGTYLLNIDYWDADPNKNIWVFKLSDEGDILWQKSFANEWEPGPWSTEISNDFVPDNTGHYIISGEYWKEQPGTGALWIRPMFIRIDTAGNEDWGLVYGVEDFFVGETYGTTTDSQGNVYSAGQNRSPSASGEPLALFKVSTEGEMIWAIDLNQPEDSVHLGYYPDVSILDDTLLFATGNWNSMSGELNSEVFKLDTSGTFLDRLFLSDLSYIRFYSAVAKDNKIAIVNTHFTGEAPDYLDLHMYKINSNLEFDTVYTQPLTYDSLCDKEILSDTIPLDSVTVNLDELKAKINHMSIAPNPAKGKVRIEINLVKMKERQIMITDLRGKEIMRELIPPGCGRHQVDVSRWKEGLYIFGLYEQGTLLQTEKVLILY